ncbi:hypothetical protein DBR45_05720 [Pseudomonas sp. HMWF031]|nr:hypothetical protein DBR45_05720 [Pseudomonas sp. HMWF031]
MLPERIGQLGGRLQWACHFLNVRRKALYPVVSGYRASGWAHFGALVEGITFWCAVFAGKSLLDLAEIVANEASQ